MLIIKRNLSETIDIVTPIGDTITIMLTETCGWGVAKIGIDAPLDYVIYRGEIPLADRRPPEAQRAWRKSRT